MLGTENSFSQKQPLTKYSRTSPEVSAFPTECTSQVKLEIDVESSPLICTMYITVSYPVVIATHKDWKLAQPLHGQQSHQIPWNNF